jgi:hypothetical protein
MGFNSAFKGLISDTDWPMSTSAECKEKNKKEEQANRLGTLH